MATPIFVERTKSPGAGRKAVPSRYGRVLMHDVLEIPHYDTCVPVLGDYWVGNDLHLEPYIFF